MSAAMANPMRGEVAYEFGGETRRLKFTTNAICALEDEVGMPIARYAAQLEDDSNVRLSDIRRLFAAAGGMSAHEAGEVIDELGLAVAAALVTRALMLYFPQPEAKPANPRTATAA